MPNVPKVPGVPSLASYSASAVVLMVQDLIRRTFGLGETEWGIFLDGEPAIEFRSFVSVDYRQDWSIADYPMEGGAFQSYDKVQLPFDVRVRVASGGKLFEREQLLAEIDEMANSLDLFDVVTPEKVYVAVNCSHYDMRRNANNGVGMITLDVWFTQIRETATQQFSNTQQPSDAGRQNGGNVQPRSVPPSLFSPNLSFL